MPDEQPKCDPPLSGDQALTDPKHDLLGRAPFAEHLAESIMGLKCERGFVFALYGEWGCGKSTLINFVESFLKARPDDTRPIIVRFNPWWMADAEHLVGAFLSQLKATVAPDSTFSAKTAELGAALEKYSGAIGGVVGLIPVIGAAGKAADIGAAAVGKLLQPGGDLSQLRKRVETALTKVGRRVVVIMDDIDRLTDEEIRTVFRLVKAVADFPNVAYLLAFDHARVARALQAGSDSEGDGEAFIRKIVQLALPVPPVGPDALLDLLGPRLDAVLAGHGEMVGWDASRWFGLYGGGIRTFLRTPRDVSRYANVVAATYPHLAGEVNAIDFLGIQALWTFCPQVHAAVCADRDVLFPVLGPDAEAIKEASLQWVGLASNDQQEAALDTLKELFPAVSGAHGGGSYGAQWNAHWASELRVCSETFFDRYFDLHIPADSFSKARFQRMVTAASDKETTLAHLRGLLAKPGPGREPTVLRGYLDHLASVLSAGSPVPHPRAMLDALLEVGDAFVAADLPRHTTRNSNDLVVWWCLRGLAERIGPSAFAEALADALRQHLGLGVIVYALFAVARSQADGKHPDLAALLPTDAVPMLRDLCVEAIHRAAESGDLRDHSQMASILHRWEDWTERAEVAAWVADWTSTDEGVIDFLGRYAGAVWSSAAPQGPLLRVNVESLRALLPEEEVQRLAERSRATGAGDRSPLDKRTSEMLLSFANAVAGKGDYPLDDAPLANAGD